MDDVNRYDAGMKRWVLNADELLIFNNQLHDIAKSLALLNNNLVTSNQIHQAHVLVLEKTIEQQKAIIRKQDREIEDLEGYFK